MGYESLMNMHIHIWTLVDGKDNGDGEVCWPLSVYSVRPIQRHKFSAEASSGI